LIPAKLARAMSGTGPDLAPSADAQGSAKVALLSMDRSLRSWAALRSVRPPGDSSAHALITQLTALRHDTERRFPTARRFLRPGFDDPEANEARRRSDRSGQDTSRS
jgi:hypothetical protein